MGVQKQVGRTEPKGGKEMDVFTLFTLAAGLSMDAFAVSVCKGLAMGRATWKKAAVVGVWVGGFQALMPAIGSEKI